MPNTLSTPADPFADPIHNALHTAQAHLAEVRGLARKFPRDIAPFAAVEENSVAALTDLHTLLEPGEATWIFNDVPPAIQGLVLEATLPCLQMAFPPDSSIPGPPDEMPETPIVSLTCDHAPEMVALTDIAFPGFFRPQTCIMGNYYGIRDGDANLVALGGERQRMTAPDGTLWIEISAVCTHPDHRGHGHASRLIQHLLRDHRRLGAVSCLHVSASNRNAIELYRRLGFHTLRTVAVHRVRSVRSTPRTVAGRNA